MTECALVSAATTGDYRMVEHRLESGDDVDLDKGNGTALWCAASNGHGKIVTLLVEWGANLGTSRSGYTAAGIAKYYKHGEIEKELEAAKQQPRKYPKPEKWVAIGEDTVAFIGNYLEIDKKLTQIFNFQTRERLIIAENPQSKESMMTPPTSFNDLPPAALEKALDEFARLGGKADRDYVLQGPDSLGKQRKLPQREPGNG